MTWGENAPEGIFDARWIPAEFSGQDRPADIIRQSYADLCFDFDHFFGRPGVAVLDDDNASVGLDQALNDLDEPGNPFNRGFFQRKSWSIRPPYDRRRSHTEQT